MLSKTTIGICIFLFFVASALAAPVNYETTAVARVVGETPEDMEKQLRLNKFTLEKPVIYPQDLEIGEVVLNQFGFRTDGRGSGSTHFTWTYSNVGQELKDGRHNYLILVGEEKESTPYSSKRGKVSEAAKLHSSPGDVTFYYSPYGGLYIPRKDSFSSAFSRRGPLIAPMSYTSGSFLRKFVCNMKGDRSIGDIYLNTRNNYYISTYGEFLGLPLMSFSLYGDPAFVVGYPTYNVSPWPFWCKNYALDFAAAADFTMQAAEQGAYRMEAGVVFNNISVLDEGNFSLLAADSVEQLYVPGELVLPVAGRVLEFPLRTVITNFSVVGFSDPVDVSVAELPIWDGVALQKRICYSNSSNASVDFEHAYTEDKELVFARVLPVEVVNCEQGKLRFYRKVEFIVEYMPFSSLLVKDVVAPSVVVPGQRTDVHAPIEWTKASAGGVLRLLDHKGHVLSLQPVSTLDSAAQLDFIAPDAEGLYTYKLEYVENNVSSTYTTFKVGVRALEATLTVKDVVGGKADAVVYLKNNMNDSVNVSLAHSLSQQGEVVASGTKELVVAQGVAEIPLSYDVQRSNTTYDMVVALPSASKVLAGTVFANRAPVIGQASIVVHEGEVPRFEPAVTDANKDPLQVTVRMPVEGMLSYESSGNYSIEVKAGDGIEEVSQSLGMEVLNRNRAPVIAPLAPVNVTAKEMVRIVVNASDPDNENSVSNDDNTLAVRYDAPFNTSGEWQTLLTDSGDFTAVVFVSDGELTSNQSALIHVEGIACEKNADCGTDGYEGTGVCDGDFIAKDYRTYTCSNPGTVQARCDSAVNRTRVSECAPEESCVDEGGGALCKKVRCATDKECPSRNQFGEVMCWYNNVVAMYYNGACVGKGTRNAHCELVPAPQTLQECGKEQSCVGMSCRDIICRRDDECGGVRDGVPFCRNATRVVPYVTGGCIENGTRCADVSSERSEQCTIGCKGGECTGRVSCTDSDGQNYAVRGNVTLANETPDGKRNESVWMDYCADENVLMEYSCAESMVSATRYECPAGCSYGVCTEHPRATSIAMGAGESRTLTVPQKMKEVGVVGLRVTAAEDTPAERMWVEAAPVNVTTPRTQKLLKAMEIRAGMRIAGANISFALRDYDLGNVKPPDVKVWHIHNDSNGSNVSWPTTPLRTTYAREGEHYIYTVNVSRFSAFVLTAEIDGDGDGIPDAEDNCLAAANAGQENLDGDSAGDACDGDDDNDGIADWGDNCPRTSNFGQGDADGDGAGDACDSSTCVRKNAERQVASRWDPNRGMPDVVNVNCIGGNTADGDYGSAGLCGITLLDFRADALCDLGWTLQWDESLAAGCDRQKKPSSLSGYPRLTGRGDGWSMYCGYTRENYLKDRVGQAYFVEINGKCCKN